MSGSTGAGGLGSGGAPTQPAGPTGMFSNPMFNSAPLTQSIPQYVEQPSSEGPASAAVVMREKMAGRPAPTYSRTQARPDWARPQGSNDQNAPPAPPAPAPAVAPPGVPPATPQSLQALMAQFQANGGHK